MFKQDKLDSGLKVITAPMKGAKTVTVMLLVGTGSDYEEKGQSGMAHFLEHMFSKGTEKRPTSFEVSKVIDEIGGSQNAWTSHEATAYYLHLNGEYIDLALDWLSDNILNSKFNKEDIEKEKGVVREEIRLRKDTPSQYVWWLWDRELYPGQSFGRPVLGSEETISNISRADIVSFIESNYSTRNSVVVLAGDVDHSDVSKVEEYFSNYNDDLAKKEMDDPQKGGLGLNLEYRDTDQSHFCLGFRGESLSNKWTQKVIASILGGMVSSRLFYSVRVENGLAYYIRTIPRPFTNRGELITNAGVDRDRIEKAIKLVLEGHKSLLEGVDEEELKRAKESIKGRMLRSLEQSSRVAPFYGEQALLEDKVISPEQALLRIDSITSEDVLRFARERFVSDGLNLAIVGPYKKRKRFQKLLNNF